MRCPQCASKYTKALLWSRRPLAMVNRKGLEFFCMSSFDNNSPTELSGVDPSGPGPAAAHCTCKYNVEVEFSKLSSPFTVRSKQPSTFLPDTHLTSELVDTSGFWGWVGEGWGCVDITSCLRPCLVARCRPSATHAQGVCSANKTFVPASLRKDGEQDFALRCGCRR